MTFVRPVIKVDQTSWCETHVEAFRFFGGAPARLVPDNFKTGVDRPDLYDPRINRAYGELVVHYGVIADPVRAFKPVEFHVKWYLLIELFVTPKGTAAALTLLRSDNFRRTARTRRGWGKEGFDSHPERPDTATK
jgi:transposase